jgi:hypothetical protein
LYYKRGRIQLALDRAADPAATQAALEMEFNVCLEAIAADGQSIASAMVNLSDRIGVWASFNKWIRPL